MFAWGANSYGQLGLGHKSEQEFLPKMVALPDCTVIKTLVGGGGHTLAVSCDGCLYVCGWNKFGQLGLGHHEDVHLLTKVPIDAKVLSVAGGWDFSIIVLESGVVLSCGSNIYGQLGRDPDLEKVSALFSPVNALSNITMVDAGLRHAVAVDESGLLYTWGQGTKGQLGRNTEKQYLPQIVGGLDPIHRIGCGQYFTICVTRTNEVIGFGDNKFQQIDSNPEVKSYMEPHTVCSMSIKDLSCGWTHVVYFTSKSEVVCRGRNNYSQCGGQPEGSVHGDANPVLDNLTKVLAGSEHCLALDRNGLIWCWGWNEHGNCGFENENVIANPRPLPRAYFSDRQVQNVFVGSAHCFATV